MVYFTFFLLTFLFFGITSQVVFIQNNDLVQKLQSYENDTIQKTQFLPIKANLSVLEKDNKLHILEMNTNNLIEDDEDKRDLPCQIPVAGPPIRNSTYEIKDGKLYKITKVRKKMKRLPCEVNSAQRRNSRWEDLRRKAGQNMGRNFVQSFANVFPKLSSNDWQNEKTEDTPMVKFGNALKGIVPKLSSHQEALAPNKTDDRSWQFWTGSQPIISDPFAKKKEKIKKLLNLFTIVQFDNEGCFVDGLKGTCYSDSECGERNGRPMGPCARGFGVCCYIERSCGEMTTENCTYFVNEGFPNPSQTGPNVCSLSVRKAHPDVSQLRLEFETFELRGPVDGNCLMDRFFVSGQNRNSIVPDLCGVNTGQHVYVDVDGTSGPMILNVVSMGQDQEQGRRWRVKVTQLRAGNALLAPRNCLQYFTDLSGVIESFNYQHALTGNAGEATSGYLNNLNYDVCIKKSDAFCSVTYSNQPSGQEETDFQLINMNKDGESIIPRGQAGAEIFNCPDDYIVVNGVRLCGDKLNDATTELDYTKSAPVIDQSAGPAQLTIRTDQAFVSRGFRLEYKQNPCLD